MNLNRGQIIGIAIVILGVLAAGSAQLTDLFGPMVTKDIVSGSNLLMSILAGIMTVLGGPSSQVEAVRQMPGVESIFVNGKANATLAKLAVSPEDNKVEAIPAAAHEVAATARAAG